MATGKRCKRGPDQRVRWSWTANDQLETDIHNERRCQESTHRHSGGSAPSPENRHTHNTDHEAEIRRTEKGHDAGNIPIIDHTPDPSRHGFVEPQQPLRCIRYDDPEQHRERHGDGQERTAAQRDAKDPRGIVWKPEMGSIENTAVPF